MSRFGTAQRGHFNKRGKDVSILDVKSGTPFVAIAIAIFGTPAYDDAQN